MHTLIKLKPKDFQVARSVIKIIYKKTGEIFLLTNYRPISLINVDLKILTKALANRLKYILPSIIHVTQTAVYGRKIDQTVHLIRDLIDLANKDDEQAAFIFLDQEKAFDRVNHNFLYKTMRSFGIGEQFISWVRTIYSNASLILNINGFLSKRIPMNRGVRQGCPLSALLYVLVIEVLAIQLRVNPNIVGFKIGGEKIVSTHYVDDATIVIKQNRCFKEVIKELTEYEEASGAKVNYGKTEGLWAGAWKERRVSPINIKWTNKNVFSLGIFFGNNDPAKETYNKIIPDVNKKLNYWKQFTLSDIGKARVVEIFLSSKLNYAMKFYSIPTKLLNKLQSEIFSYINFPRKVVTIAQREMWKIRLHGGIKLPNIQIKSETVKAKCLIEMTSKPELNVNLNIFIELIGKQKGNISGGDLIFLQRTYMQNQLQTNSSYYKEALLAVAKFELKKGIKKVEDWDKEHVFYNPLFKTKNGKTFNSTKYFEERNIFSFGQMLEEKVKEVRQLQFDKSLVNLYNKITLNPTVRKEDMLILMDGTEINFTEVTLKQLYEEAIHRRNRDHHSQVKWTLKLNTSIVWEDVWNAVHNILSTNKTKNTIWHQIHLNFYTQYSYNKWHNRQLMCPLCLKITESIYHTILHCNFANTIWQDVEPTLLRLHPEPVTEEEKAFGLIPKKKTNGILLRNWITYLLRESIEQEEKEAYYTKQGANVEKFKQKFKLEMSLEIKIKSFRYKNENNERFFENIITHAGFCEKDGDGGYRLKDIFH